MDKAGIRVLGKNYWLWTFRTPDGDVVVVIRPSRGQNVLREFFGGDINGAGVVDGWRAYNIIDLLRNNLEKPGEWIPVKRSNMRGAMGALEGSIS